MKLKNFIAGLGAVAVLLCAATVSAQMPVSGPGIVVSGSSNYSQVPAKAKAFVDKHFKKIAIRSCEKNFIKGTYDVDLDNGVEIVFDKNGCVIEIEAAENSVLPVAVVKDVMHSKAFSHLEKAGMAGKVESIEFNKKKVCSVELQTGNPDTYLYDVNGVFIAIVD